MPIRTPESIRRALGRRPLLWVLGMRQRAEKQRAGKQRQVESWKGLFAGIAMRSLIEKERQKVFHNQTGGDEGRISRSISSNARVMSR